MEDKRKALYDALSGEYDLGSYEDFTTKLNDENKRRALYDAAGQDYNLGSYEEYSEKLGFGSEPSGIVPMFNDEPQGAPMPENVEENSRKLRGLWANFKESSKGLWAGLKGYAGEQLNLFTGSSREEQAALNDIEQLEEQGVDVMQYLADKEDAEFHKSYGMSKDQFLSLDKKERKRLVRQASERMLEQQSVMSDAQLKELKRRQTNQQIVEDAFNNALEIAGGDLTRAKEILREQAADKTKGDILIEEATETMNNLRQPEGFAGWVGNMLPQMVPAAASIAINYLTKGKASGLSKALGYGTMGGLTLSTAGMSMIEARNAGATNLEVWATGIADGAIEIISEKIPFDRVTKRVFSSAKANVAEKLGNAVLTPKGRKELEKLLSDANEKLGGKLFSKKNIGEWLTDTAYEAAGEFTAEALQTITTMIYENPEDYPTISEVLANGWEGAKAGLFMGSITGGASLAASHAMNKDRRQTQGYVDVAQMENENGDVEVVEVVGEDPQTGNVTILHGDTVEEVSQDKLGDRFRFSYDEFENGRLRSREDDAIDNGVVNDGQIRGMEETIQKDLNELRNFFTEDEINQITSGTIPSEASAEGVAAARKYMDDVQRIDDLHAAKAEQDQKRKAAVRDRIESEVGQRFWVQEEGEDDGSGVIPVTETVEEVVYSDGRVGYVVGSDEAGNLTMVYNDGSRGFSSRAEIAEKENSGEILSNTVMGLDDYLAIKVDIEDVTAETTRMEQEQTANVRSVKASHPVGSVINVGTAEAKVEVPVIATTADGVIVQMPDGTTPQLTWADVAHAEGQEVKPKTNAELDQEIVDEYRVAYQPAVKTGQEPSITEREIEVEQTTPANPLPLKADGSVDQTALWNKDPERWAQWNDEQRQDGGANSLAYVSGAIAKEQAKIAELQAAYEAESDFDARNVIEKQIADTQERVGRLTAIQQGYVAQAEAEAAAAPAKSEYAQTELDQSAPVTARQERTTESVLASLTDGTLTDEEIRANIDANLAEAKKSYDKYAKKAPKMGIDKDAYLAEKKKYEQGLPALQQEIDFWNGVKGIYENVMQQEAPPTAESFRLELTEEDINPRTPQELAARELGLMEGGIKLLWDSVKAHTGFGNGERQKFFGIFRSKDKGGMTIEAAGDRLMEMDREYNLGLLDQNDPMAGVNAILDVLGDVQTIGDLRNYIANNREIQVAREADAAYSAMNAEFVATHGMTMEDAAHADHVAMLELMHGKALSEAEQYEINVKFAEEENHYGTDYSSETGAVSRGESGENQSDVARGVDSSYRQSDSILQETQSDITRGETISDGQAEENVSESNEQDGDSSVYAGEQAEEIEDLPDGVSESSLDEDMPDFTNSASAYFPSEETRRKFSAMRARIKDWAQKLGVQVSIMETLDDVVNQSAREQILKGRKVYGYFDTATGEVAFYLPDFLSTGDEFLSEIDKTYIHEVVAHRGLRGLLGEEKYGELCDMVWDAMTEQQKAKFLNYPGVNGNTRAAADEFIAHFAENVDYADNRTMWDKIVDFIKDLFGSISIPVEISNESMAGLLRQSYIKLAKDAKAATNANANQQAEGNTVLRAANGSLVGMHNISEDKLRKVIKQGGSANPSTAVIDIDRQDFTSYGDISLVMPSSLVDAETGRNAGTFTADAWTPTYPKVERRFSDDELQRKYWRDISAIPEEMQHEVRMAFDSWLNSRNDSGLAYMFLQERGEAPEMVRVEAKFPQEIKDKVSAILGEGRTGLYELSAEEKQAMLELYIMENFGGNREEFDKSIAERIQKIEDRLSAGKVPSFVEKRITVDLQWMKEHGYDYDQLSEFVRAIAADIRHAGEVNDSATTTKALDYIKENNLSAEFEKWKENLSDRYEIKEYLFDGYTPSGNQRWLPNTVENASRLMNKQGLQGATGMAVSFNRFVATLAPKKKSLSEIRASKERLVEDEQLVDAFRDKWSEVFFDLGVKCQPDAKGYEDYGLERLTEAAQKKNPGAYLKKEYGVELSQEDLQKLSDMIKAIKTEFPARYFETKFQRPVYLNEFAAAVMPTTTSEDIKQAVSEAGLPIFEYDSSVEGSRKEATLKATEGEGVRFRAAPSDRVLSLFNQARAGELGGKPISIGSLTKEGKEYLERISGIKLKENVSFVLNPSDLNHIYNDHYGKNEKDTGNNIPLNDYDIRRLVDVIAFPTRVVFGEDKQGRKVFYFLSETPSGTYNLMEIYANKKGNLTAKTYYKTKKGATQRVMELESLLSTSETYSGATLSDAKIPILFDIANEPKTLFRARITPEQDKAYMDAVAAGDMETAQRMVEEAARLAGYDSNSDYQGSLAFNGAAPSGYAYYDTKEERIEAWESGEYEDDQTLGDYKDAGIDISNLGWSLTSPVAQRMGNEYTRESIKNLADAVNSDSRKIKVYRAVDADIKEDSVRNGDWVTPSRAYAEYHIGLQDWKEGRIIEQEVDIDDIWWDGNDINEWGYNDGKGYAYKNTPNNRKLLAPVTYDDNGKVIPLSERFNEEKSDIRFRIANENQAIFVSNAAKAVEGIKMEKATPEQWLKMIEKNGGLKAGEDKWMGLSDWLKESDKKTLTKQEVLDFINENMIQIEEVHYAAGAEDDAENTYAMIERILQEKFGKYIAEYYEQNSGEDDDLYGGDSYEYAMDKLREEMNDKFPYTIERSNSVVYLTFPYEETDDLQEWADKLGIKFVPQNPINSTRLDYTTDGLNNKHEIALTVPTIESWNDRDEVHFGDAGDGRAVAWIRFGDKWEQRPSPQISRKVLVIDEIQSKRHQEGREKGYKSKDYWPLRISYLEKKTVYESLYDEMAAKYGEEFTDAPNEEFAKRVLDAEDYERIMKAKADFDAAADAYIPMRNAIPDAPFDKNWHELAMKRMLRYAAENGYDVIAWTTGDQQAERYNIGSYVSSIEMQEEYDGNRDFGFYMGDSDEATTVTVDENGIVVSAEGHLSQAEGRPLADLVGKDMAVKMMQMEEYDVLEDTDLKVGNEGMKGFYDRMLPAFMNKYGKKWGVKVEDIELRGLENGLTMHSVPVTEEMKASVMEGQVMFRVRQEDETPMEFEQSVLDDFKKEFRLPTSTTVVDINDRDALAAALGYTPEEFTDEMYNDILAGYEQGGFAFYERDTKRIAIFAREELRNGIMVNNIVFHENTHYLEDENPEILELGEWLWQNSEPELRRKIKEVILESGMYEGEETYEMLAAYTGYVMSQGKADVAYEKTPSELQKHWELIFNAFGYEPRGKEIRRRGTGDNSGRVGSLRDRRDAEAEMPTQQSDIQDLTAEERRIIGEYFPEFNKIEDVRYGMSDVNTNPTEAQKKAGNYKMGHLRLDGYNITIENPKGSVRRGTDSKGNAWENTLNNDYGYIRGTEGVDGDHIDVYLSDNPTEGNVFVIDQVNPETREFDEHKVMYGFDSAEEAREAYLANFSEGWNGLGTITEVSKDEFKKWIESSHRKTKPFSEYKSVRANEMQATDDSELRYRVVSDQETLDRLNSEPTIKVYRAMQLIDGKLYPPMSAKVDGELRQPIELGQWEEAEERPDLVDEKGRFKLDKGNKSSLKARYNPYFHTSPTPLNDQFSSAQTRPELVTVEVEVPESELTSGYKAEKAKDSVGKMEWKAGVIQSKLSGTRTVILSRWDKPVRIVPDSEVADVIVDMFEGKDITMPSNVVTPSLRAELEKRGVPFVETDNQGNPVEEVSFRVTGTPTDEVVANGLQLTSAQTAEVAANIFAALPEESRKKITDGLNGNILGLKDAILQIPTSLASKENWNDEDKQMADVVAEEMTKIAGEMTRPFSAEEGLWLLYNNLNKGTDLISQASRALVQRNLGFDAETLAKQEQAKEDVRFRTVGDATSNAQASLYNRGAVNVWTRLKESFVDMQASVEELVKAIEKRTGKVAQGFENILLALNQQSSKGLAAMESYTQKFLNPMFDEIRRIMDDTKMKYEDIVRYVILKHGLERNKKLAQRDARAHYQEIYDDIISKITGMTAAQKRTYLTNAQLKEGDAKAELATLQAVDMSAMTDEEKREHKKKLAAARKAVEEAEEHLKRAQKIASLSEQEAQDELDKIFEKIENGTDSVYKEMRENDYSGISSMFYDQLGVDRKKFSTEEQYQAALMEAKKDRYSSLANVEAAAEAEVKSFEGKTDTKELWKRINAATKETLRQQYEANMISKDQYDSLRNMFEYYVPLRGFKDNTAEDMYTYYRKPNSTGYTKPILGAEGRKTEAESPFGWIAAMAGSAIASNVKNEAKLALYYFVSNRPENGIATISRTWFVDSGEVDERGKKIFKPAYPPFSEDLSSDAAKANYEAWQENMRELQKKGQAYEAGQRLNLGNAVVNISDANKPEHIVNVKVGGKDYTIIINGNPRAAQAINGDLNIETNDTYNNVLLGPWLRWLSSVNTSYNPEFWATNMMRDVAFTIMAVSIKGDAAYQRKFFKNYRKAFKVISLAAKNEKGTIGDSYLEEQYKDFVKYGGVTGFTQIKDSETWEKEIENYLKSQNADTTKAIRAVKDGLHAFHRFGESLEQVSRFAAFITAREMGKSMEESINDAKEITVNFNRKGSGKRITFKEAKLLTKNNGQRLNDIEAAIVSGISYLAPIARSTIMFFNAAVQALNAWFKLWKANKLRSLSWVIGYAAIGVMNALIHALLDDDDEYLDIPQYERRSSLMLGGNGVYFKWALPQEMSVFYALGELSVEAILDRNPHQSFAAEAAKVIGDVLPVNIAKIIIEEGGWVEAMPSQIKAPLELLRNENYKGDVIFNDQKWLSEGERERTANWESAYRGTGRPYIEISRLLNNLTDSKDLDEAGWINIHPESLEHVVESMTGGVGRTVSKLFNFITAAINPEEDVTVKQTPFLNRFLTINDERFKNVHVNDVFDYYEAEAEHALTLEKEYTKERDMEAIAKLRGRDEYQWAKIYGKYKKPLKAIQDKIKVADGTAEKKELMKQQDELKKRMIKEISEL